MRAFRFGALFAAAAACCVSSTARAEPPRYVRLDYARQEGAAACPDAAVVREGVAARLGYEPFDERAGDLVRATIRTTTSGLEARIELVDGNGTLKAERRLVSHRRDCSELASSVELAVSIAIDPLGVGAPARKPTSPPPPEALPPALAPSQPAQAERPVDVDARPLTSRIEASLVGSAAKAPSYAAGLRAAFALSGKVFSLGLEGQADVSANKSLAEGHARATLWTVSLVPCARRSIVAACALATAGVMRGSGSGLRDPRTTTLPYVALGVRLLASIPVTASLAFVVHADATAPLTEESLKVGEQVVWTSPYVAGALGLGLAKTFP